MTEPVSDAVLREAAEHAAEMDMLSWGGGRTLTLHGRDLGVTLADVFRELLALRSAARSLVNRSRGDTLGLTTLGAIADLSSLLPPVEER